MMAILLGFASLGWAVGCSGGPQFAEVEGQVTLNGRPLQDVEVLFMPDPEVGTLGPPSSGYTDERGHYQLATNKGQSGAVVGTHRVCLRDLTTLPTPPVAGEEGRASPAGFQGTKAAAKVSRVPVAYNSSIETPLRSVAVKGDRQVLDFEVGSGKKK